MTMRFKYVSTAPTELRNDGAMAYRTRLVFAPADTFPTALNQTVPGEVAVELTATQGETAETTLAALDRLTERVEPLAFMGPELPQPVRRRGFLRRILGRA